MLKRLTESLHNARNPFFKIKKRFPRYVMITCCTGTLSFLAAWLLLSLGFGPLLTLVVSALASGLLSYTAMELWAFPHRTGRLSFARLSGNALVGVGGFTARYAVLTLGLRYLHLPPPLHTAVPLLLAYLSSFIIGYLLRCHVVFKHDPTSRRCAARPSGKATSAPTSARQNRDRAASRRRSEPIATPRATAPRQDRISSASQE